MDKIIKIKKQYIFKNQITPKNAEILFQQKSQPTRAYRGIAIPQNNYKIGDIITVGHEPLPVASWSTKYEIAEGFSQLGTAHMMGKVSIIFDSIIEGCSFEDCYKEHPTWDEHEIITPARQQYQIIDITKKHLAIGEEEMFCVKRLFPNKEIPTQIPYYIIKLEEVK